MPHCSGCGRQGTTKFCVHCGKPLVDAAPAPVAGLVPAAGVKVVAKGSSEFREPPSGRNSALDYAGKRSEDEIQRIREQRAEEDKKKNEQMAQELAWRQAYQ